MWVWIPRYEYKITGQAIDINFIPTSTTQKTGSITEGYRIHPAFEDGSETGKNNHYMNGEWDSELPGIWVAKFEASREDSTINAQGSSSIIKIQPNVKSRVDITIGEIYTNSLNMYPKYNSHLMKNSEWGAVAYLSYSRYGRNGVEITINDNKGQITGGGDYKANMNQSSTGNTSGIYDLSGGTWEYTATYISNGDSDLSYGSSFVATTTANPEGYKTLSTKYATVYPYNGSNESSSTNWDVYNGLKSNSYGYGDAILETSTYGNGITSWNREYSYFPSAGSPFFCRSGIYTDSTSAGVFTFQNGGGIATSYYSFRVVVAL